MVNKQFENKELPKSNVERRWGLSEKFEENESLTPNVE